jgi:hypothetical protein
MTSMSVKLEARVSLEDQRSTAVSRSEAWESLRISRRSSEAGSSGGVAAEGSNHLSIVPAAEGPASFNADQSLGSR